MKSHKSRLYVIFKVEFPSDSNGDTISEMAEQLKDMLYEELSGEVAEIPCINVTYEKVVEYAGPRLSYIDVLAAAIEMPGDKR